MNNEIWKDIEGFENLYQVSSLGRVRSISNEGKRVPKILKGRMIKQRFYISLRDKNGKCVTPKVAILVANAFLRKEEWQDYVEHIDGNEENNRVDNLKWSNKKNEEVIREKRIKSREKGANIYRKDGNTVYVVVDKLGHEMICDEDIWEKYKSHTWFFHSRYVRAKVNGKETLFHRLVKDCPNGYLIDHINRNTLDNRRENLRITTPSVNSINSKTNRNNKLKQKGVYSHKNGYVSTICEHRKYHYLGKYKTLEDAIEAREKAEKQYHLPIIEKETLH